MSYHLTDRAIGYGTDSQPCTYTRCSTPGDSQSAKGLFHAWENQGSSLLNELMPDGYPIAPRWIRPTLTASLTATECLLASESAENASASLLRWNVVSMPGIRWVRWGGRGDELRLPRVVIWSLGTDQTLATGGGRPTSVHRHRSRVVWLSPDEGTLYSSTASICGCRLE